MNSSRNMADALRSAILKSDRTISGIAVDAHISPGLVSRFISAGRDLRLSTAAKIANVLGLELTRRE